MHKLTTTASLTYIYILSLLFSVAATPVQSQNIGELGTKRIKYFSAEDYEAHAQNWCAFQDERGMLYFGNNSGILEYDGVKWEQITSFVVRCFSQGKENRIYAGGDTEFGFFKPGLTGKNSWTSLSDSLPPDSKNFLTILSIHQNGNEVVFFGFKGIFVFRADTLFKIIHPDTDFRFSFKYNNRIFVRQTDIGLMEYKDGKLKMCCAGNFFADKPVYMLEPYNSKYALLATRNNGLFLVNIKNIDKTGMPHDSVYIPFSTEADNFFREYGIYHGALYDNDNYAIGSSVGGMVIIDKNGHLKRVFNKNTGLVVNNVNYIFCDRENNLWLALNNGITYIEMNSPMNLFGEETGYQGLVVGTFNFNNRFYLATLEGLYVLTTDKNIVTDKSGFYRFKRISPDYNSFMYLDTVGGELLAATRYGLYKIDGESVTAIKKMEFSYIFIHSKANPYLLFVNNAEGLCWFIKSAGKWKYSGQVKGIGHEVRYMYEDDEGNLWINGNKNNLLRLSFTAGNIASPVISEFNSDNGLPGTNQILIANINNYLTAFIPNKGYYRFYSEKSPVGKRNHFYPDPSIPLVMSGTNDTLIYFNISRYNDTTLYAMTGNYGLIRVISGKHGSRAESTTAMSGQAPPVFFLYPDKKNNLLWYSTNKGLFSHNLSSKVTGNKNFITVIRKVEFGKDSLIKVENTTEIQAIPFDKNSIIISFAALSFQGNETNSYSYCLEGLNNKWTSWGKEKYVTYNFLPEGTYVFRVKGKNIYGAVSEEAVFTFTILPPWYRTWWALVIYISVLLIAIVLIVIIYGKRLKRKNLKLEEIIASRTAEIIRQHSEIEEKNKELEKLSIVAREVENSVIIMDAGGRFEWVNDGFKRLYGYSLDELITEYGNYLYDYSRHPEIRNLIKKCVDGKSPVFYETIIITKDKKELWAHTTLTPVTDSNGNVARVVGIDSDITKLKTIEKKLTEQNEEIQAQRDLLESANRELEKLSIVASQTDNMIMILDKEGAILWVNESLLKKFNNTFGEFIRVHGANLQVASYNPNIRRIMNECISKKKTVIYDSVYKTEDGKVNWTQTTLTPIMDENGEIKNIISIDSDITKIKKAEEKIKSQSEELEKNLEEISGKNKLITNSIEYAKKIQEAILPSVGDFKDVFPESFIYFRPRDVVSGDFFWVYKTGSLHFAAVVDCTGHGVPGAFMSVIGNALLNEIVIEKKIYRPDEVLFHLNQGIISALRQNEASEKSQDDGMDITFIAYDSLKKRASIGLAGQTAILVNNKGLNKISGDMFTIGGTLNFRKNVSFRQFDILIDTVSTLYMYSDGYQDQFGGTNDTKLMAQTFETFLKTVNLLPFDKQLNEIDRNFLLWKGKNKQIDDILVIGIKFSDI